MEQKIENLAEKMQSQSPPVKKAFKQKAVEYLKGIPKRWFITAFSGMAIGLFCTLIAGTIIQTLALIFQGWAQPVYSFLFTLGYVAKIMMGAGIGVGIAYTLKAPKMVVAGALAAGFLGAFASEFFTELSSWELFAQAMSKGKAGNPISCYLCALAATELGILVSGKTKLDILVVPLTCLIAAGLVALVLGRPVDWLIGKIAQGIDAATKTQPFIMSIIISVAMGLLLTMPTSSAAIGVSIGLSGIAAGAAVAGCCAHMIGFAVISFKENRYSGLISQGLGTSMLQIPNIAKKPVLLIPPVIASAICGPLAALVFKLQSDAIGSGMGTAGLVGVIQTIKISLDAGLPAWRLALGIIICLFILPAAISLAVCAFMRKRKWIKFGDLKIE